MANDQIKITKAAVLMGCNNVSSGISPAIAQTVAALGIDLGSIQTKPSIGVRPRFRSLRKLA